MPRLVVHIPNVFNFVYYITGAQKSNYQDGFFCKKSLFSTSFDALHDNKAEAGKIFCIGLVVMLFVCAYARTLHSILVITGKMCRVTPHNVCYAVLPEIRWVRVVCQGDRV